MMAKENTEIFVGTSPSVLANWWDLHSLHHHHRHQAGNSSLSSWANNSSCSPWHQQNPNSNDSSCEDEVSNISSCFSTYASNHSGLNDESSHRPVETAASTDELMGEHAPDNRHLWSHVLLDDGNDGDLHKYKYNTDQEIGEISLLNPLSSKIFDPAYDYLKKMDTHNWEFANSSSSYNHNHNNNNFEEHLNGNTTNSVTHWSLAPPDPETARGHLNGDHVPLSPSSIRFCDSNNSNGKSYYYGHNHDDTQLKPFNDPTGNGLGYHNLNSSSSTSSMVEADNNKYYYGLLSSPHHHHHHQNHSQFSSVTSGRNFADAITLSTRLMTTKPLFDHTHVPNKPYFKSSSSSECKKQGVKSSYATRINGKEKGASVEGKKKRAEENSEAVVKKLKPESSTASSAKAPKVKLADKITSLQQIVSPFGKTDTASVLYEAIGYIQFLQEQVQLLSNPYMKLALHKDPWGSLERNKDQKGDAKVDLRSRGLCLVPISCAPKIYHENTGSDYWTPAYRGCLYR